MRRGRLLLASLVLAGCGDPTGMTRADLEARMRWAASAPSAYEFTTGLACFCVSDYLRPVVVSVRNGKVEALRYEDDGTAIPLTRANEFPTIDGLFAIIAKARAHPNSIVTVEYDLGRGYPVTISIDYDTGLADDETWYSVRNFSPR
jgi:hypothetical protein